MPRSASSSSTTSTLADGYVSCSLASVCGLHGGASTAAASSIAARTSTSATSPSSALNRSIASSSSGMAHTTTGRGSTTSARSGMGPTVPALPGPEPDAPPWTELLATAGNRPLRSGGDRMIRQTRVMLDDARRWVQDATRVTVLTGAGISTDSGIPDFRGPNGVWTKNPAAEKTATLQNYLADPEVRRVAWLNRMHSPAWLAEPNAGHAAIVELERQGKLVAVVTQNVDELHQQAGNAPAKVIEVHG